MTERTVLSVPVFRVYEPPAGWRRPLLRERATWKFVTVAWLVIGITTWLLQYVLSHADPGNAQTLGRAATRLVYMVIWWAATILAIWLCDHLPVRGITRLRDYATMLLHVVIGLIVAVLWCVVAYYVNLALIPGWLPQGIGKMIYTQGLATASYYVAILGVVHAILYTREHQEREIQALRRANATAEAQVNLLKMELQPHFLFNALHSISALMHQDVGKANEMLCLVSDMLRHALNNVREQEVTLQEETETVTLYVQIQQVRFQDRLQVTWDVDPEALRVLVPHMILQPLIENAIKHGIESRTGTGRIDVVARRAGDWLELAVRDNGPGLSRAGATGRTGIGITNTRERLAHLYGEEQSFSLEDAAGGGALAAIRIPARSREEDGLVGAFSSRAV